MGLCTSGVAALDCPRTFVTSICPHNTATLERMEGNGFVLDGCEVSCKVKCTAHLLIVTIFTQYEWFAKYICGSFTGVCCKSFDLLRKSISADAKFEYDRNNYAVFADIPEQGACFYR